MTSVELFRTEQQLMTYHTWEQALRDSLMAYARAPFLIGDLLLRGRAFPCGIFSGIARPYFGKVETRHASEVYVGML